MIGSQQPRIQIEPHRVDTDGTAAGMLMAAYGTKLDPWQQLVLDAWCGVDENGNYTAMSCGLTVARQSGKSEIILALCFYELLVNGSRILLTCHQIRTSKKAFRRLAAMFEDKRHPEIMEQVKQIRRGIGEEAIELHNGGCIEFTSRSNQTGRGFDGISVLILDEAQTATEDQIEAIMSVLSASATGQRRIVYAGTSPTPGCGDVFRRFRQSCLLSADKDDHRVCWHEWSPAADSLADIDISDRHLWYECNPALGLRLSEEFTAEEMRSLSPDGFARERLNFWAKPVEGAAAVLAIDPDAWERCKSDDPHPKDGKIAYGVKFTADGSAVVLAGCVMPEIRRGGSGRAGTEPMSGIPKVVDADTVTTEKTRITLLAIEPTGAGLQWLAKWLNERYNQASCVVIDGRGGADVLIEKLRPAGGGTWTFKDAIIKAGVREVLAAASGLINDIAENSVSWYAEQDELNESALTSTKRPISGGFGFGGTMAAPIEACALALYGCRTSKRNPQRKMRINI